MKSRTLYPKWTWVGWVLAFPLALIVAGFALVATTESDTLMFDGQEYWWLGSVVPLAGVLILYGTWRRRRALERFTSSDLVTMLTARVSPTRQAMRSAMLVLALLMVAAGVIGPRWGMYLERRNVHGVDIVVALDVSRSMLARDVEPNRIERAKLEVRQQLTERTTFQRAHRLALIAFAGSTSLRLPLTTDHLAFRSKLEAVTVGTAPRGGTALAEAIRASADLFARSPDEATKVILLLTDGEDHAGQPAEAARMVYEEQGIRTFTIGVGDASSAVGAQVPIGDGSNRPMLYDGQIVFSKLDVPGMNEIADAGGGRFASIRDLNRLVDALADMHKVQLASEDRIRHKPRYQWFLAMAVIFLAFETFINERRSVPMQVPQRGWQQEATL